MVDWDWIGSWMPNTTSPSGMICTGSARVPAPSLTTRLPYRRRSVPLGHELGQSVGPVELAGQHTGPHQVEVGGDLPREAHAPVHLDAAPAVGDGGLDGQQPRAA